jgi:uncharacterized protein YaeQ
MALAPTRLEFRIQLSNVDRGVEVEETVIVARHPSETQAHAVQRVLARCLLHREGLEFGPGLSTPEAADLWAHGPTGELTTWVECGAVAADKLRKVLQHNHRIEAHVVLDDPARPATLAEELRALGIPRSARPVEVWLIEAALIRELAAREERRQRWVVTVVGDSFYVDVEGRSASGAVTRTTIED